MCYTIFSGLQSYIVIENATNCLTMPNTQTVIKILEQVIKQNEIKQVLKLITWFKLLKKNNRFWFFVLVVLLSMMGMMKLVN